MQLLQTPAHEQPEFDRLCEGVQEFEPLPDHSPAAPLDQKDERVNETILAGLISPV